MQNFVEEKDTETITERFIRTDMRGLASHGIFRFPGLLEGFKLCIQCPKVKPEVMRKRKLRFNRWESGLRDSYSEIRYENGN